MFDNGAFKAHNQAIKQGRETKDRDWKPYYQWLEQHMRSEDWFVIPDVIDGGTQWQDALLGEVPAHLKWWASPVWHLDEPIDRLLRLCDEWPRVSFGSTAEYWKINSPAWVERMTLAMNAIDKRHSKMFPWIHGLRMMAMSASPNNYWRLASVDSTDVAQNHHLTHRDAVKMARNWDALQCLPRWQQQPIQMDLIS